MTRAPPRAPTSRARAARSATPPIRAPPSWVSANAGTGKTHVLTMRVLRLMLAGTHARAHPLPHLHQGRRRRDVEARLRHAGAVGDDARRRARRDARRPRATARRAASEIARARTLFTVAIETPGGLKVQTIHAFCERLLQRFPLEADVPPGFTILDERDGATRCSARRSTPRCAQATATSSSPAAAGARRRDPLCRRGPLRRDAARRPAPAALARGSAMRIDRGEHDDELRGLEAALSRARFKVRAGRRPSTTSTASWPTSSATRELRAPARRAERRRRQATRRWRSIDRRGARGAHAARRASRRSRDYFCTDKGEPRARLMTKGLKAEHPRSRRVARPPRRRAFVAPRRTSARGLPSSTRPSRCTASPAPCCSATRAAKARRAALDYDDLIAKTRQPAATTASSAAWVLFKLDRGIDHILVDEAQDTSPEQWQIVEALAAEFFTGAGAARGGAHAVRRRRREAVDLQLPGRRARASSPRWASASPSSAANAGPDVAAHPARPVVPHRRAGARRGRSPCSPIQRARRA